MIVNFIIDLVTVMFCPCPLLFSSDNIIQNDYSILLTDISEDSIRSTVSAQKSKDKG